MSVVTERVEVSERQIQLPAGEAALVLGAHALVLFSALPTMLVGVAYADSLHARMASPALVYLGVAVYTAGIAFEIAQNSADRWYLTEATRSLVDGIFNTLMGWGFALVAAGCSDAWWLRGAVLALALAYPLTYAANSKAMFPLMGWLQIAANIGMYLAFGDHLVVLHLVFTFVGVYCLTRLFDTLGQWLHGVAALAFAVSILSWPLAMWRAAEGYTPSWAFTAGGVVLAGLCFVTVYPLAKRATASPRPGAETGGLALL